VDGEGHKDIERGHESKRLSERQRGSHGEREKGTDRWKERENRERG